MFKREIARFLFFLTVFFVSQIIGCQINQKRDKIVETEQTKQVQKELRISNFPTGEFVVPINDSFNRYLKIDIEIKYKGPSDNPLKEKKAEIRDAVNSYLNKVRSDLENKYKDESLQKELRDVVNTIFLGVPSDIIEIIKINIPAFIISD